MQPSASNLYTMLTNTSRQTLGIYAQMVDQDLDPQEIAEMHGLTTRELEARRRDLADELRAAQ